MSFQAVSAKHPCEACGKKKRCGRTEDGGLNCYSGPFDGATEKQDKNGDAFWQRLPSRELANYQPSTGPKPAAAPLDQRHKVYVELLDHLILAVPHKEALLARGFEETDLGQFKSLNRSDRRLARRLAELFQFWEGVPGLYLTDKGTPMLGGAEGLLIPCRDLQGQIQALRIRSDNPTDPTNRYSWLSSAKHGGPSPGGPASYWPAATPSDTSRAYLCSCLLTIVGPSATDPGFRWSGVLVRITEGELKAAAAAKLTGIDTISGGAGIDSLASSQVQDMILEKGATVTLLAPDADARWNPAVNRAVRKVIAHLQAMGAGCGFSLYVEIWQADESGPKGIDDALQAGASIRVVSVEDYLATLPAIAEATPPETVSLSMLGKALLAMASQTDSGLDGLGFNRSDFANLPAHLETVRAGQEIAQPLRARVAKILYKYEAQLLKLGFNVNALAVEEKRLADEAKDATKGDKDRTQVEKLHEIAEEWKFILFEGQPYAVRTRQNEDGSNRTDTLRFSRGGVRQALMQGYYSEHGSSPAPDALKQVCDSLEARALFEGKQATVWLRTGTENGRIYLDLCDELGRVVVVSDSGWSITQDPPVYFQRTAKMLPLPLPEPGGSIQELRSFVNVDDSSFILIVAWLLFSYFPLYPHPILLLEGIEGSAKSTIARILRSLIDSNSVTLRKAPRDGEDIAVAAANNWIVAFDNVSQSIEKLTDEFCGLATGSGHARRAHYSNDEESSFSYLRPALFTALPGLLGPPDFVSRTLRAVVPVITDEKRLLESEIGEDKAWEQARPRILGAFLDAVSCALANHGRKRLGKLPRLADFAQTVHNAEERLPWEPGAFIHSFYESRLGQVETVLESDPLAVAIRNLLSQDSSYEDGATDFIKHLATKTSDNGRNLPHPVKLPAHLRRLEHSLRQVGIGIRFRRVHGFNKIGVYLTEKHNFTPPEDTGQQPTPTHPQTDFSQSGTDFSRGTVDENNSPPTHPQENLPTPNSSEEAVNLPTPNLALPTPKNGLPTPIPAPNQMPTESGSGLQNGSRGRVGAGISPLPSGVVLVENDDEPGVF